MLHETTLGYGGPRIRILSKISGALGALRTVLQWQRKDAGNRGCRALASAQHNAKITVQLGAAPRQVLQVWPALISLLVELHKIIKTVLHGFGLDDIKCVDPIRQSVL